MAKVALRHALFLCVVALFPALGTALLHPKRPNWNPETLKKGEVLLATVSGWKQQVLWVDARSRKDYENSHIPNALLLNEDEWDTLLPRALDVWVPGSLTVVYCNSRQCQASRHIAERLREAGLDPVYILKGGWEGWRKIGK